MERVYMPEQNYGSVVGVQCVAVSTSTAPHLSVLAAHASGIVCQYNVDQAADATVSMTQLGHMRASSHPCTSLTSARVEGKVLAVVATGDCALHYYDCGSADEAAVSASGAMAHPLRLEQSVQVGSAGDAVPVVCMAADGANEQLATGDATGCIALRSLRERDAQLYKASLAGGMGPQVNALAFLPYSANIVVAAAGNTVTLVDCRSAARTGGPLSTVTSGITLAAPDYTTALSIALPTDDPWTVATGCEDGTIFIGDLRRPDKLVASGRIHDGPVWAVEHLSGTSLFMSGGEDGALLASSLEEGVQHRILQAAMPLNAMAILPGDWVVAGGDAGSLHLTSLAKLFE